jgi:hypothetical protein
VQSPASAQQPKKNSKKKKKESITVVKPSVGMSANWNHDWFIIVQNGLSGPRKTYIVILSAHVKTSCRRWTDPLTSEPCRFWGAQQIWRESKYPEPPFDILMILLRRYSLLSED